MNLPIAILIIIFLAVMTVYIFKNGARMDKLTKEEQETIIRSRCSTCRMSHYCNDSKLGKCSNVDKSDTVQSEQQ